MRFQYIAAAALPLCAHAYNIVLANDDGWAEMNIRTFYNTLVAAGENVVLSAPAENESGTGTPSQNVTKACSVCADMISGSSSATPTVLTEPCEFDTCPTGSPAEGFNASNPRLNYVNSYPVDAISYGIQTLAPQFFNGSAPDFAVSGFNVGSNLGDTVLISGTVGAAVEAIELGIPAVAFSGDTGTQISYAEATPLYATVYAELSTNITQTLLATTAPYLPSGVWLNVNFPAVSDTSCSSASDFQFVLSQIYTPVVDGGDVETCNSTTLPTETDVVGTTGCYVSISPGTDLKLTASEADQAIVLAKLQSILSCLPASS